MAPYAWHAPTCTRPRPGPEPTLTVVLIFTPVTRLPDPHTWQACGALCATCSADAMAHSAVARARAIPAAIAALRAHEDVRLKEFEVRMSQAFDDIASPGVRMTLFCHV